MPSYVGVRGHKKSVNSNIRQLVQIIMHGFRGITAIWVPLLWDGEKKIEAVRKVRMKQVSILQGTLRRMVDRAALAIHPNDLLRAEADRWPCHADCESDCHRQSFWKATTAL